MTENNKGYFPATLNGNVFQMTFVTNSVTGWKIISYTEQSTNWSSYIYIFFCVTAVCIVFLILMATHNANYISKRVLSLKTGIDEVRAGNLHERIHSDYEDEFGYLCDTFNAMLDRIEKLVFDLAEEEEIKRKLEIEALQAQINPHFLYNTLAAIRFNIQMKEYSHAEIALLELVKLLRKSFSDKRVMILIGEEFEMIEQYMKIMQLRYQDTFIFTIKLDPTISKYGIIKHAIQPLVENSISHGFNRKKTMGHIVIEAVEKDDSITIIVEDDGIGGDIEKIHEILDSKRGYKGCEQFSGIGIQNVHLRLKNNFGKDYGITVCKNIEGGVTFHVNIPRVSVKEIDYEYCDS